MKKQGKTNYIGSNILAIPVKLKSSIIKVCRNKVIKMNTDTK